jgi:hypothetical protein
LAASSATTLRFVRKLRVKTIVFSPFALSYDLFCGCPCGFNDPDEIIGAYIQGFYCEKCGYTELYREEKEARRETEAREERRRRYDGEEWPRTLQGYICKRYEKYEVA